MGSFASLLTRLSKNYSLVIGYRSRSTQSTDVGLKPDLQPTYER